MSKSFQIAIERILSHEGGYVNDPRDPGGETQWGISKRAYPNVNIRDLTRAEAIEIYRRDYWIAIQGDLLPPAVAFQVMDAAVNHGRGNAVRWLQRAAGVAADGALGPVTLSAINDQAPADLLMLFNAVRLEFYASLSTFSTFGRGWTRRIAGNLEFAAEDLTHETA